MVVVLVSGHSGRRRIPAAWPGTKAIPVPDAPVVPCAANELRAQPGFARPAEGTPQCVRSGGRQDRLPFVLREEKGLTKGSERGKPALARDAATAALGLPDSSAHLP